MLAADLLDVRNSGHVHDRGDECQRNFFRAGTTSQSEIEFALGRMVENVRAATIVSSPSSTASVATLTLTNLGGNTVTYRVSGNNLVEIVGTTTSTVVHGTSSGPVSFSVAETSGNSKAFTITVSVGTQQVISRTVTVFGRNL